METITKKTVSIEFKGQKYTLSDEMTLEDFLKYLGLTGGEFVILRPSKNGFVLISV